NQIVELDRGKLYIHRCNYETYLERREAIRTQESKHQALFDKRLAEEETWIRTGIKARRTRNEGRVRALKAMREAYRERRAEIGKIKTISLEATHSGKIVIEANNVNYNIHNQVIIQ